MATPMTSRHLLEAILDQGIKSTNFFDGRVLTADDLKTDQAANRRQHEQLGQAIGSGVVSGLEVDLVDTGSAESPPIVSVSGGIAINPLGQVVGLGVDIPALKLGRQQPEQVRADGMFAECIPPKTAITPPSDRGVYVLVAAPASGYREQAPKHSFVTAGTVSTCGDRFAVEGVRFRLAELKISQLTGISQSTRDAIVALMGKTDIASLSKLQNWLAHVCFGTEELAAFWEDPLAALATGAFATGYGAIDVLRSTRGSDTATGLTDCEVPLALLFWMQTGVQFVDNWSVRRALIPRFGPTDASRMPTQRRLAEAMAASWQFQHQVDQLLGSALSDSELSSAAAAEYFRYLPPAGLLSVQDTGSRGFDRDKFFGSHPHRDPEHIEGARMHALLDSALSHAPIDLSTGELVWLYKPREAIQSSGAGNSTRPFVVFTTGHMPPWAIARYDIARWDFGRYVD